MLHDLKIKPEYFSEVVKGIKTFEVRKNDRGFKVGDKINLREINNSCEYTGRHLVGTITYITDYAQKDDYVVFAFKHDKEPALIVP